MKLAHVLRNFEKLPTTNKNQEFLLKVTDKVFIKKQITTHIIHISCADTYHPPRSLQYVREHILAALPQELRRVGGW